MDFLEVIQRMEGETAGVGSKLIYDKGKGEGSVEVIESELNSQGENINHFCRCWNG